MEGDYDGDADDGHVDAEAEIGEECFRRGELVGGLREEWKRGNV